MSTIHVSTKILTSAVLLTGLLYSSALISPYDGSGFPPASQKGWDGRDFPPAGEAWTTGDGTEVPSVGMSWDGRSFPPAGSN